MNVKIHAETGKLALMRHDATGFVNLKIKDLLAPELAFGFLSLEIFDGVTFGESASVFGNGSCVLGDEGLRFCSL